ncbi:MAG: HNH endonuclease [Janthinobacterium lividum]
MNDAEQIAAEVELAWQKREQVTYQSTRAVRRALLAQLAERQNWCCCHCGTRIDGDSWQENAPTFEHVIPRSRGGTDDPGNLVAACRRCNGERSSAYWPEHRRALAHSRISVPGTSKPDELG